MSPDNALHSGDLASMDKDVQAPFYSLEGRISRTTYCLRMLALFAVLVAGSMLMKTAFGALGFVAILAVAALAFGQAITRGRDAGISPWLVTIAMFFLSGIALPVLALLPPKASLGEMVK